MTDQISYDHPIWDLTPTELMIAYLSLTKTKKEIADIARIFEGTVGTHLTNIFVKLDLADLSDEVKRSALDNQYGEILRTLVGEFEESYEEYVKKVSQLKEARSEALKQKRGEQETPVPPQMMEEPPPPRPSPEPPRQPIWERIPRRTWAIGTIIAVCGCILLVSSFVLIPLLRNIPVTGIDSPTGTQPLETETVMGIISTDTNVPPTQFPTRTQTETPTLFSTETPTSNPSPIPSQTSAPYYFQNEAAELKPDVYLSINPEFGNPNFVLCWAPKPGYSLKFDVTNNSSEQFLLRFNWYDFRVEDDQGQEYEVKEAGIDSCSSEPGLRSVILGSNSSRRIFVTFAGEIGTNARYLLVTVENISGSGPFVFRKDF